MPDLSIWIAWIVGLGIAATLVALTWHSLFGDKAPTRRCPRCQHALHGTESRRCPECGHEARSERALYRPKRHYARALTYLAMLVGGAMFVRFKATQQGPIAFLPTSVVLWLLPNAPASQGPLGDVQSELITRLVSGSMDEESLVALADRLVAGDDTAQPGSAEWQNRYSRIALELVNAADAVGPDSPLWRAAARLRALPADASVRVGRAFREGGEIPADVAILDWWPVDTHALVHVTDRTSGLEYRWLYDAAARRRPMALRLAPGPEAETERTFEISIRTRANPAAGGPGQRRGDDIAPTPDWGDETVTTTTVALQPPVGRPLEPLSAPEFDAVIDSTFSNGVIRYADDGYPVAFRFDLEKTRDIEFDEVLFGVTIDLLEGEAVRRTLHAWWPGGPRGGGWRAEVAFEDIEALKRLPDDGAGWSLRVRGREEIATRAFVPMPSDPSASVSTPDAAIRWWSGERTLPVRVTVSEFGAPRRAWRPVPTVAEP